MVSKAWKFVEDSIERFWQVNDLIGWSKNVMLGSTIPTLVEYKTVILAYH